MISALDVVVLFAAGMLAGTVGTAGAITSLVSYPALLVVGIGPLAAGIANIVAVSATWPGSALASRRELTGQVRWLARHGAYAVLGGAIGTALLLSTPASAFARIVPFLVAAGSLALLAAPRLGRLQRHRAEGAPGWLPAAIVLVSVYNGYFGAGAGVMLLAVCLIGVDARLPTANALKNMLVGAATIASAAGLIIFGSIAWHAVIPLALGLLVGGVLGPAVARRVPPGVLRPLVAVVGLGLAVQLWFSHGA
jgi:uncharacterized membrane protein YfcA